MGAEFKFTLNFLPSINGMFVLQSKVFVFVLIGFVGTDSLCCFVFLKMQLFTSSCLSENYPSMTKKSGPITISEKQA